MSDSTKIYFEALERHIKGRTNLVPKGSKINYDTVALEAGRGKGSIKKSRGSFADVIKAIDAAAAEQSNQSNEQKVRLQGHILDQLSCFPVC